MASTCVLGMVGSKNGANVFVRNVLDVVIGGISYWCFGYGFSFGPNSGGSKRMSGNGHYFTNFGHTDGYDYAHYVFQLSFAVKANSIVSGESNYLSLWIHKGKEPHR